MENYADQATRTRRSLEHGEDNTPNYNGDGIAGYHYAIENSGKYHVGYRGLIDSKQLTSKYSYEAWQNYSTITNTLSIKKYFYVVPRRF